MASSLLLARSAASASASASAWLRHPLAPLGGGASGGGASGGGPRSVLLAWSGASARWSSTASSSGGQDSGPAVTPGSQPALPSSAVGYSTLPPTFASSAPASSRPYSSSAAPPSSAASSQGPATGASGSGGSLSERRMEALVKAARERVFGPSIHPLERTGRRALSKKLQGRELASWYFLPPKELPGFHNEEHEYELVREMNKRRKKDEGAEAGQEVKKKKKK